MPYIDPQVILEIKNIDLLTYFQNYEPIMLYKRSSEYRSKEYKGLVISNGKWHMTIQGIGGVSALDFLVKVRGLSFMEAVNHLINCTNVAAPVQAEINYQKKSLHVEMPKKDIDDRILYRYLQGRGISMAVIRHCVENKLIYQSTNKYGRINAVFVGYDQTGKERFACLRGTEGSFFQDAPGSNKCFSFSITAKNVDNVLHIFESGIDALSYATLIEQKGGDWTETNYLSLSGVYRPTTDREYKSQALDQYLNDHPNIKKLSLHLDNDEPGRAASSAIVYRFGSQYSVEDRPPPTGKDVNEHLNNIKSRSRQSLAASVR